MIKVPQALTPAAESQFLADLSISRQLDADDNLIMLKRPSFFYPLLSPCHFSFFGQCTSISPPFGIFEFCQQGNLRDHLRCVRGRFIFFSDSQSWYQARATSNSPQLLEMNALLVFAEQICSAMKCLARQGILHLNLRSFVVTCAYSKFSSSLKTDPTFY